MTDDRRDRARAIPILDVAHKLGIHGLRPVTPLERAGACPVPGCPEAGGAAKRDADRFAINTAKNVFQCRQCHARGDQIALVEAVAGVDFLGALEILVGAAEHRVDPAEAARRRAEIKAAEARQAEIAAQHRARAIADARRIWAEGAGHDTAPAAAYLAGRGLALAAWPPTLRMIPDHPYVRRLGGASREWHRGPCLVAAIQDRGGRVAGVHRTWFDPARPGRKAEIIGPDGAALPAKLMRGSAKGGAIRLSPLGEADTLVMGEGIETTLTVMLSGAYPGAAFWAGASLGNMGGRQVGRHSGVPDLEDPEAFVPPPQIRRLVFLMDGDSEPRATRAQLTAGLRRAQHHIPDLVAQIFAAPAGLDFNDMLQETDNV